MHTQILYIYRCSGSIAKNSTVSLLLPFLCFEVSVTGTAYPSGCPGLESHSADTSPGMAGGDQVMCTSVQDFTQDYKVA